ncbi:hypothetical protein DSO57_1007497 [Entomophthora muscae]|uniref:Uncharacterized protein n=1 Tax=Entomophthora muscae TaxID=34485 RepID=A0ACC2TID0_9FUNG|nr:hypothetical protein DSO57_1007497 [Entomophthora muscae]
MTPPHTPQPNRLQESVATDESTPTQIFGPQSCGGPSLPGLQAVCPQVLRNSPWVGSLTNVLTSGKDVLCPSREVIKHVHELAGVTSHQVEGLGHTAP